jgi:hypothetical protein
MTEEFINAPENLPFLDEAARRSGWTNWCAAWEGDADEVSIVAHAKSLKELGWKPEDKALENLREVMEAYYIHDCSYRAALAKARALGVKFPGDVK